jgi:Na+-driven multidrug efflux pump
VPSSPPLWKRFLVFLVPMMLSNILHSLFGTMNSIYLGQMIGVDALAAVSAFFPVMFLLISFVMGLGSGAATLIGQAWGAGEPQKVKAVAGTTTSPCLARRSSRSSVACSAGNSSSHLRHPPAFWMRPKPMRAS